MSNRKGSHRGESEKLAVLIGLLLLVATSVTSCEPVQFEWYESILLLLFILWIIFIPISATICSLIAYAKGRSILRFLFLGLFLSYVGLTIAIFAKNDERPGYPNRSHTILWITTLDGLLLAFILLWTFNSGPGTLLFSIPTTMFFNAAIIVQAIRNQLWLIVFILPKLVIFQTPLIC